MSFQDYDDLCVECEFHDKCHKNGIDYAKVEHCQIDAFGHNGNWLKIPKPKPIKLKIPKEKPKPIKVILI